MVVLYAIPQKNVIFASLNHFTPNAMKILSAYIGSHRQSYWRMECEDI